jgi:poly-gamma-glutamate synthesis protein (capsule biosynthesis protein)
MFSARPALEADEVAAGQRERRDPPSVVLCFAAGGGTLEGMLVPPEDPRALFRFSAEEAAFYDGVVGFARASGVWRWPAQLEGDYERMGWLDLAYWMYKAQYPIERAVRGSGLERYFARQAEHRWGVPAGLSVEREVTVSAVGDLFCSPYLGGSRGWLYAEVAEAVLGADASMANLECQIVPEGAEELSFSTDAAPVLHLDRSAWEAVRGHEGGRFDLLATANNHSLDFGAAGLDRSLDVLDAEGIEHHGANRCEEDASRAAVLVRGGIRIGVVSWTFGLNAHVPPVERPCIVNRTSLDARPAQADLSGIEAHVRDARERGCDFVIAQLHWGMEHERYPRPEQVALAHALAERGIDAIFGHHPHMIQPLEAYRTERDPDRIVPIFYSLGNLTSFFRSPCWCHGGLGRLRIAKGMCGDGRSRAYVIDAALEGLQQEIDDERRRLRLRPTGPVSSSR